MDDSGIHQQISELIATERRLRDQLAAGELSRDEEHRQLREAEVELDRLWDLLRQRDARREYAEDPDAATERPGDVVERYEG